MASLHDVNWAEVVRETLKERLEAEEKLRRPIDRRRALGGAHGIDAIRERIRATRFDSTREVRKWRDSRK
ncbi:MAG: hypothetical protein WCB19_07820 [Thermoplasmata archaeon]